MVHDDFLDRRVTFLEFQINGFILPFERFFAQMVERAVLEDVLFFIKPHPAEFSDILIDQFLSIIEMEDDQIEFAIGGGFFF